MRKVVIAIGVIAVAFAALVGWEWSRPTLDLILLRLDHAQVFIDEKPAPISKTYPLETRFALAPGRHTVRLVAPTGETGAVTYDFRSEDLANTLLGRSWCLGVGVGQKARGDMNPDFKLLDRAACEHLIREDDEKPMDLLIRAARALSGK